MLSRAHGDQVFFQVHLLLILGPLCETCMIMKIRTFSNNLRTATSRPSSFNLSQTSYGISSSCDRTLYLFLSEHMTNTPNLTKPHAYGGSAVEPCQPQRQGEAVVNRLRKPARTLFVMLPLLTVCTWWQDNLVIRHLVSAVS